jgi:hypothetical protein
MLHCHIALICYIILICYTLLHCFCCTTLLWYATLLLFYDIALICYIATLHWYATLVWYAIHCYITFVLLYYSKYSYIATLLWYATHCFCSTKFLFMWIHTTLLNDESELSEMSVAIWTNIVLLGFQLRTTWSRLCSQISSSLSQSRWIFWSSPGWQIPSWRRCHGRRRRDKASSELTQTQVHLNVDIFHAVWDWNHYSMELLDTYRHLRQGP